MNARKILFIQVSLEAALPLFGFLFWDWSLYFVTLYYLLELISDQFFIHFKASAIKKEQGVIKSSIVIELSMILFLALILILAHLVILFIHPEYDLWTAFLDFMRYEEMGIQQAYLILPLVFFAGWQQYKIQFLNQGAAKVILLSDLLKKQQQKYYLLLVFTILCLILAYFLIRKELVYILLLIGSSTLYKLLSRESLRST